MNSSAEPPLLRASQPARSHWLMFTGLDWLIPMVQCACSAILFIQGLIWENRGVYFGIFPIDGSNFSNWSGFLHTCCTSGSSGGLHACGRSLKFKRAELAQQRKPCHNISSQTRDNRLSSGTTQEVEY